MAVTSSEKKGCLQGKVVVITGAARGIGRAAAVACAHAGADIIGIDICKSVNDSFGVKPSKPEDLNETGKSVQEANQRWMSIILDQRDLSALRAAAEQIEHDFGGIDILFANAGVQGFSSLLEMDDAHWHTHIDVNLTGTANTLRAFAPYMIKRSGGRIILTSSTQGQHGMKNGSAYSTTKWGIIAMTLLFENLKMLRNKIQI